MSTKKEHFRPPSLKAPKLSSRGKVVKRFESGKIIKIEHVGGGDRLLHATKGWRFRR